MRVVYPRKLSAGDHVRVVAPALSKAVVDEHDHSALIEERFAALGLRLSYGEHVGERDAFQSSSIAHRIHDLHAAFADESVDAIMTVIGGFNSNELLPHLDVELIAANPKILCGYSDITALQNAILTRTGLVTYSGPHWSTFGMRDHFETTLEWFAATLMSEDDVELRPSPTWTDDAWFLDQDARVVRQTDGWWPLRSGRASATLIGGNLCTLNLLQGTEWMPSPDEVILAVEDDAASDVPTFARDLTSLVQCLGQRRIRGLMIGRFEEASAMTRELLDEIVERQGLTSGTPVVANVDFGHTDPLATLPIGGRVELDCSELGASIVLTGH